MKASNFIIVSSMVLCLLAFSAFAEETASKEKTQGEFAVQLCKALGLEVPTGDYITQLESKGIAPEGGWQASKPISNTEMADILAKALGLEKKIEEQVATKVDEAYRNKATIIKVVGNAEVKIGEKGDWTSAQEGMKLTQNDTIKTGPGSSVDLRVGMVGGIKIKENSELKLSELSSNPDGSENITLYMNIGEVLVDARGLKKGSDFQVHTTTTVAAVRGTIYNVKVSQDKTEIAEAENK